MLALNWLSKVGQCFSRFLQKIFRFNRRRSIHHGGVLIEFAFSIPVLISLMFFACDHYRYYELKNKIKTSAYLAASMIQQVSNTRANKRITDNDLSNIAYASCLNFFHTSSMFYPWPFGVFYSVYYYWVKRVSVDNYSFQEGWATTEDQRAASPASMVGRFFSSGTTNIAHLEELHHDLICNNDGEERLLIICAYRKAPNFNKSLLGFFILDPKIGGTPFLYAENTKACFEYKLVITPKPGLFSDK